MTGGKGHLSFPAPAKDLQEPSKRQENSIVGLLSEETGPHTKGILEEQGRPQSTAQEPLEGSGFPASRRCGSCKCDMNMLIHGLSANGRAPVRTGRARGESRGDTKRTRRRNRAAGRNQPQTDRLPPGEDVPPPAPAPRGPGRAAHRSLGLLTEGDEGVAEGGDAEQGRAPSEFRSQKVLASTTTLFYS